MVGEKMIKKKEELKLNLGCGFRKMIEPGWVNIDNRAELNPDVVCDVTEGLPYEESSVDYVKCFDFLEHIPTDKVISLVEEIYRVLKPGGIFESFTPDAEFGMGGFQDFHHKSFWVENSWLYFSDTDHRVLYGIKANFEIVSMNRTENKPLRIYHLHVIAKARK